MAAIKADFEEKTFEGLLNIELSASASFVFPIGQVQEGGLGADVAFMIDNMELLRYLDSINRVHARDEYRGVQLAEIAYYAEQIAEIRMRHIPNGIVNVLFQYKRPEFVYSAPAKQWALWNQPYYRYHVEQQQQLLLSGIGRAVGDQALVIYASPAIHQIDKLIDTFQRRQLVAGTNFCNSVRLDGHSLNTYIDGGGRSIGHSEPEEFPEFNLMASLEDFFRTHRIKSLSGIVEFAEKVGSVVSQNSRYGERFVRLRDKAMADEFRRLKYFRAILTMAVVRKVTGLQWIVYSSAN